MCDYERASQLWDQYKYRHEHCWKLLFQITAAAVIISIVPYTHIDLPKYVRIVLPGIAVALIAFSIRRVNIELKLWQAVRIEHLKLQKSCFDIVVEIDQKEETFKAKKDNFKRDVVWYLSILGALALLNGIMICICQLGEHVAKTPSVSP